MRSGTKGSSVKPRKFESWSVKLLEEQFNEAVCLSDYVVK